MGGQQVTTLNLEVVQADPERELMLVKGAVPGPRGGIVVLRDAVKAPLVKGAGRHERVPPARRSTSRPPVPAEIRRFLRPAAPERTVTRRSSDGADLGEVALDAVDLRHRAQPGRAPPGGHRPAGRGPLRHPVHQDPGRGPGRRGQAVPPEGHRPGPAGLDPVAPVGGRRRGPRAQAPVLRPEDPEEDDAAGAALGAVGPGRPGPGGVVDAWPFDVPEHQGRRRRPGGPGAVGPGAGRARATRTATPIGRSATCPRSRRSWPAS